MSDPHPVMPLGGAESHLAPAAATEAATDVQPLVAPRNYTKLGLAMMLGSGVLWAPLPVLPFLNLPASVKVAVGTLLFVGVQIAWWGGTVLAGPATVRKVYALFRKLKWWKKAEPTEPSAIPPAV